MPPPVPQTATPSSPSSPTGNFCQSEETHTYAKYFAESLSSSDGLAHSRLELLCGGVCHLHQSGDSRVLCSQV